MEELEEVVNSVKIGIKKKEVAAEEEEAMINHLNLYSKAVEEVEEAVMVIKLIIFSYDPFRSDSYFQMHSNFLLTSFYVMSTIFQYQINYFYSIFTLAVKHM